MPVARPVQVGVVDQEGGPQGRRLEVDRSRELPHEVHERQKGDGPALLQAVA